MQQSKSSSSKTVYACLSKSCSFKVKQQEQCFKGEQPQVRPGLGAGTAAADAKFVGSFLHLLCCLSSCGVSVHAYKCRDGLDSLPAAAATPPQPADSLLLCFPRLALSASLCAADAVWRNLLNAWVLKASRQNVPRHQVVHWIRRKAGAELTVWRVGRTVPWVPRCPAAGARRSWTCLTCV